MIGLNFEGRLANTHLSPSKPLLPLFEAIANSIQSIADRGAVDGRITVSFVREGDQLSLLPDDATARIITCMVEDNGIGFTDQNYNSFCESDSRLKASRGGKGVGRLMWLHAFGHVTVSSSYKSGDAWATRRFSFSKPDGVTGSAEPVQHDDGSHRTTVRLEGMMNPYRGNFPTRLATIATRLIEHFMVLFACDQMPTIVLCDSTGDKIDVLQHYADDYGHAVQSDSLEIDGNRFTVHHVPMYTAEGSDHRICYCASLRAVCGEKIARFIKGMPNRLTATDGRPFVWSALVSSPYLDANVDESRHRFNIPRDSDEDVLALPDLEPKVSLDQIRKAVVDCIRAKTVGLLDDVNRMRRSRVGDFIRKYPRFMALGPRIETHLDSIPPDATDEELYEVLSSVSYAEETRLVREGRHLRANMNTQAQIHKRWATYAAWLNDVGAIGMASLAQYVAYRKLILDFLADSLATDADGKYGREEDVHAIIMPTKVTSAEVPLESQNLWVLDDRLAFHDYVASDVALTSSRGRRKKKAGEQGENLERPDLLMFHAARAFADDATDPASITIVEFKRPARTDYGEGDSPIAQVRKYAQAIREGRAINVRGRPLDGQARNVPINSYVVCDFTEKIREWCRAAQLDELPGGDGYFGYAKDLSMYIEVRTYNRVLADAVKRNTVFFQRLGIDGSRGARGET